LTGKRKRGRPRKEDRVLDPHLALYKEDKPAPEAKDTKEGGESDQTNSAAEGLLELSNVGPDGVRRSSRRKKKNKILTGKVPSVKFVNESWDWG
jgi:hypothetical protein